MEYKRQPYPIRIVEGCGCGFLMGTFGGGLFQYFRGCRTAPSGLGRSIFGGIDMVKMKTPAIAGSFAIWGATFSTVDYALASYRKREDSWNSIASGAATGGILSARHGIRAVANNAVVGGIVLAIIEGVGTAVGTIYATDGDASATITSNVQAHPQRPQWEPADSVDSNLSPENSVSLPAEESIVLGLVAMLEKCREYRGEKDWKSYGARVGKGRRCWI